MDRRWRPSLAWRFDLSRTSSKVLSDATMTAKRTIEAGESLLQLAYEEGFDTWKRVWNHPENAELREARKDPQVLLPGDALVVPERETEPKESCPVDKIHRFVLVRPRAWVNLSMLDDDGSPLAGLRYVLTVDGKTHEGSTDSHGLISVEIRPTAHEGELTVWLEEPDEVFKARVQVGHLDPASSLSGARARLRNLGLPCAGEHDDDIASGPSTRHLLETLRMTARGDDSAETIAQRLEDAHDRRA